MHQISEKIRLIEAEEEAMKGCENTWYVVNEDTEPLLQMHIDRELNPATIDKTADDYNKQLLTGLLNRDELIVGTYQPTKGDLLSLELRSVVSPVDFLWWYHFQFDGKEWKWVEHYIQGHVLCYLEVARGIIEFAFDESESPCWEDYQWSEEEEEETEEEETEEEKQKNLPKIPG